jgi:translocator protein
MGGHPASAAGRGCAFLDATSTGAAVCGIDAGPGPVTTWPAAGGATAGYRRRMVGDVARRPGPGPGRIAGLAGFAAAAVAAVLIGGLGVTGTQAEYQNLDQPSWAPPSWLFAPVWTVLYAMIALAGWLAWRRSGWTPALTVYALQLALNAAWTPIFFGAGRYGWALVDIAVLWMLIGLTVGLFWRISRPAALLLMPYWLWVSYATFLNAAIVTLN